MIPEIVIIDPFDPQGRVKYIVSDGVGRMGMAIAQQLMRGMGLDPTIPLAMQVFG